MNRFYTAWRALKGEEFIPKQPLWSSLYSIYKDSEYVDVEMPTGNFERIHRKSGDLLEQLDGVK